MARRTDKRRMTLSEHLALRAQAAEEAKAQEEARLHSIQALRELDARVTCTCPACVKLRQTRQSSSGERPTPSSGSSATTGIPD